LGREQNSLPFTIRGLPHVLAMVRSISALCQAAGNSHGLAWPSAHHGEWRTTRLNRKVDSASSGSAKKKSHRCNRLLTRSGTKNLCEALCGMSRKDGKRRWTRCSRSGHSSGQTFRSVDSRRNRWRAVLENHRRKKANAELWLASIAHRSLECDQLSSIAGQEVKP
jgi:hypothetical protein